MDEASHAKRKVLAGARHAMWKDRPPDPRYSSIVPQISIVAVLMGEAILLVQPLGTPYLLGLLLAAYGLALWRIRSKRRGKGMLSELLTEPCPFDQFPCAIAFERQKVAYGNDAGVLTFVDGYMIFEGLRTAFSIDGRVLPVNRGRLSYQNKAMELPWSFGSTHAQMRIYLFDRDRKTAKTLRTRFQAAIENWYLGAPLGSSVMILPPVQFAPSQRIEGRWGGLKRAAWIAAGAVTAIGIPLTAERLFPSVHAMSIFGGMLVPVFLFLTEESRRKKLQRDVEKALESIYPVETILDSASHETIRSQHA